jgi:hypothetical protein
MILVDVFVPGAVKTKGSLVVRNRATGAMKESVAGSSTWRVLMAQAIRDDIARRFPEDGEYFGVRVHPYPGAVAVSITAYLSTVETRSHIAHGWVWPTWVRAGDLDKTRCASCMPTSTSPTSRGGSSAACTSE